MQIITLQRIIVVYFHYEFRARKPIQYLCDWQVEFGEFDFSGGNI